MREKRLFFFLLSTRFQRKKERFAFVLFPTYESGTSIGLISTFLFFKEEETFV